MIRAKLLERRFGKLSIFKQEENDVRSQGEKNQSKKNCLRKVAGKSKTGLKPDKEK